jgi:hypothetical protein
VSTLKVNNLQVGQDATATNNFTLYQPAVPDGTVRLGVGNSGSVGDLLTVNGTAAKLQINTSTGTTGLKIVGLDTNGYSDLDINSVGTTGYSRLFFSDTAGQSGSIIYAHGTNSLQFKTGGSTSATLGGDGLIVGDFTPIDTRNAGGVQVAHSKGISFRSNTSQSVSRNWRIRNDDWGWGNLDFGVGDSVSDVSDSASDTVLSLTSSRNVGIGLTNPSYKLDVNGDIRAYSGTSRPHIYMNFDTTPAAGAAHGRLTVYKSNQNSYSGKVHVQPQYYNGSSYDYLENALVVDAYGHVGINTANPGYALDVVGDHASNAVAVFRQSNASNEGYITIDSPSDSSIRPSYIRLATGTVTQWSFGLKYADALRSFHIGTGAGLGNQKFTVTPTGNVGIGVTNPDVKLHVNGANGYPASSGTTPTGFISIRAKADGSTHGMHIGVADAAPYGSWLQCQDANNLSVNYPLILNPNGGNVGIGTTNPSAKLHVNSQRIKVNGVTEIYEAFYLNNNTEYNFDFTVFDEGGAGNSFFIIAGYNHFYNAAYGAHRVAFVSSRGTSLDVVLNIGDQNHPQAGAWTFSKPNSTTLRITKSAGTYGGAGYGFIKVTANLL